MRFFFTVSHGGHNKIFTDLCVQALMRSHRRFETGDSDSFTRSSWNFKNVFVRKILTKND